MIWIKSQWKLFAAAVVAAIALWQMAKQKELARKWQDKSVEIETGAIIRGVANAEAASSQAKLHEARAAEIKSAAEKKVGERDATTADILSSWS